MQVVQARARQGRAVLHYRCPAAHKGQPVKFAVRVPANATLSTNVRIQTVDADPGIAAPLARCGPTGCFADFELSDNVLKKFRATSGTGKITYADFTAHAVTVPLALSGFDQAFDALMKQ